MKGVICIYNNNQIMQLKRRTTTNSLFPDNLGDTDIFQTSKEILVSSETKMKIGGLDYDFI